MGVVRWLDRIDPAVWERATTQVAAEGPGLLERATPRRSFATSAESRRTTDLAALDGADDESLHPTLLNGLLERAVTEVNWELDKSLTAFASVAVALPGGRALSSIIDFNGIDVKVPDACAMIESGLYGCCSAAALTDCLRVIRRFGVACGGASGPRAESVRPACAPAGSGRWPRRFRGHEPGLLRPLLAGSVCSRRRDR